jgi:hypothetical protein
MRVLGLSGISNKLWARKARRSNHEEVLAAGELLVLVGDDYP